VLVLQTWPAVWQPVQMPPQPSSSPQ
jgi:hypothetical protein